MKNFFEKNPHFKMVAVAILAVVLLGGVGLIIYNAKVKKTGKNVSASNSEQPLGSESNLSTPVEMEPSFVRDLKMSPDASIESKSLSM
ncbi:MAG: hypothetical protein NT027_01110, partial [Proteobacteria bacterium]|nr:hypothetical protein [Pseudomonadota bacterium]